MMKLLFQRVLRFCLSGALRIFPVSRHAVVYGWPDTEGNSVEVLRYLITHYQGTVYWLGTKSPNEVAWLTADLKDANRVRYIQKKSLRGLIVYLTAEAAFYTHGLYLSPSPGTRRTFVNLWHGDGPKRTANSKFSINVGASLIVSGTQLWGEDKRTYFGMPSDALAVVGNPRIDQFARPASDAELQSLGLDPSVPFLLWLPTYREGRAGKKVHLEDGTPLSLQAHIGAMLALIAREAEKAGMRFILKPHPMEADEYKNLGIRIISDSELSGARIGFYQFLARSHAIVTDYSSVWTDYLVLARPIGFFCPDLTEYKIRRGLNVPNFEELLPGPFLETEHDALNFIRRIHSSIDSSEQRERSIALVGATTSVGATERLFNRIRSQRADRNLRPLVS